MASSSPADPDLAFVIPARNEERFIGNAIGSVAAQTLPLERLEVLVVVNGSSDATADEAHRALALAPALRGTVITQGTASIPGAKNRGAKAASAPIIIFLDADSRAAPELAARVLDFCDHAARQRDGALTVRCCADLYDLAVRQPHDDSAKLGRLPLPSVDPLERVLQQCHGVSSVPFVVPDWEPPHGSW